MDNTGIAVGLRIAASDARVKASVLDGEAAAALLDLAAKWETTADEYENEVQA
jgi:hypothetical protein